MSVNEARASGLPSNDFSYLYTSVDCEVYNTDSLILALREIPYSCSESVLAQYYKNYFPVKQDVAFSLINMKYQSQLDVLLLLVG